MRSYLKFLSRNKLYTAIEAVGLAVSLAFVIIIGSYVWQQFAVTRENPYRERIYVPGLPNYPSLTYAFPDVITEIPEIEVVSRYCAVAPTYGKNEVLWGGAVDRQFFDLFPNYRFVEGSPDVLSSPSNIIVTESFARKKDLSLGDRLDLNGEEYTVAAIVEDSHGTVMKVDEAFLPVENYKDYWQPFDNFGSTICFIKVLPGTDRQALYDKLEAVCKKVYPEMYGHAFFDHLELSRYDELFFKDTGNQFLHGDLKTIRTLLLVGLLLLLSAIFNYVNLNLALTGKRSKEMATRRLLGADKKDILRNSILESISFTAICFAAALLLAYLLTPMMNGLVSSRDARMAATGMGEITVRISFMLTSGYIAAYIAGILLLGTIAGLLPAFAASRYEPVDVIKGTFRRRTKMVLSKIFIIIQNVITVFLISMALILGVQMRHMLSRPTHSAVDNRFYLEFDARDDNMAKLLKDKIEALSCVSEVGVGVGLPGTMFATLGFNSDEEHHIDMPVILCDTTYFRLLGMEILEDFGHPLGNSVWMSESAFNAANVSDTSTVFARKINFNNVTPEYIGGIVHDFPTDKASQSEINPNGAIIVGKDNLMYASCMLIGTIGEDKSYEDQIVKAYGEYTREQFGVEQTSWVYGFIKDINRKQLEPERRTLRLLELFAVLAVLISLLGLLAMSTYFADENTKQIAVRKVFGSNVTRETWRTVRSYMVLVGVACIIGIPLAIWAARIYLQRFAYRIEGYGWVFIVAVIISLAIAFGSVLWQTLRAARTNPATELKKE